MDTSKINLTSYEERARLSEVLLSNLKANLPAIESLRDEFDNDEFDLYYRYYHQSFKVYSRQHRIRKAVELFELLAPEQRKISSWFTGIVEDALKPTFAVPHSNDNWHGETLPILQAWSHCRVFLRALGRAGREMESSGMRLEDYWALALYLYDCR